MTNALTWDQVTPIVNSSVEAGLLLLGGFKQRDSDRILARRAEAAARAEIADQRVASRIAISAARMRGLQHGTDDAPLGIIAQLAMETEKRIRRIRENGMAAASYYRSLGDMAVYESLGRSGFALGEGFATAYERGFLQGDGVPPPAPTDSAQGLSGSWRSILATGNPEV